MDVVCINNTESHKNSYIKLTIGKVYNVDTSEYYENQLTKLFYWIRDDNNGIYYVRSEYFITLDEHRNLKLELIGI